MSDYLIGVLAAFLLVGVIAAFALSPLAGFTAAALIVVGAVVHRMLTVS